MPQPAVPTVRHRSSLALAAALALTLPGLAAGGDSPPAGPTRSALRDDGVLLVNGRPVLPYGFYISTGHTGDLRLKCVELVHRIGGTVVHIEGPWHEDTRFLDRAAALGIHVVAGHTETEAKLERVRKYKDHPAIIAWTLYDDANTKSTVDHLRAMNRLVKAAAPNHLTFIPLGTQSRDVLMPPDGFFDCSDVVGWENYPVACPGAADPSLRATETQMTLVRAAAAKFRRPVWILPQTFAWPGGRVPTPAEYRNLCYVGLVNGAKGVMPWSIYYKGDPPEEKARKKAVGKPAWEEWFLPDSKELWAECGRVAGELKELAPLLLNGRHTKLTAGGDVTAACWVGEGEALVVVANLSEKERKPVRLALPAGVPATARPAFGDRPATLTAGGGALAGEVGPAEVQVYRFGAR